jgi:hypothetical protein
MEGSMRNASFVRVGSVVLALTGGLFFTHCGSDDTPTAIDETDTGTLDDTGSTDETATSETGDETSTSETGDETSAAETGDETSAAETGGDAATDGASDTATDAGCGALAATAVDVYVDKASAKPSVGTTECPFHTIKEATDLAAVSGRTIHVKGGTAATPANYAETGLVAVKNGVTLEGDGLATTKITNAAACAGGSMCAVEVQNGGTIDGFTITGTGNGIVTGATDGIATVKNVLVTGAQDGILALGVAKLTGGVQLNGNMLNGLHAKASAARTVTISGTGNEFDTNKGKGIFVEGSSKLDATGGEAKNNEGGGIYITATVAAATPHLITGMTVTGNGTSAAAADGINVASTSSLKLRDSVMQSNTHHGVSFAYSTTNTLDIGAGGNNTFSSMSDAKKNGAAGLCLNDSGATGSVNGNGNKWGDCGVVLSPGPTQTVISTGECSGFSGSKVEVAYKKSASGGNNPVSFTGLGTCTVAP